MLLQEGEAKIAALDLRVKKEQKGRADAAEVSFSTSCLTALTNQSIMYNSLQVAPMVAIPCTICQPFKSQ